MARLNIRPAVLADLPALQVMLLAANQRSIDVSGHPQWRLVDRMLTDLEGHIQRKECYVLGDARATVSITDEEDYLWGAAGHDQTALYFHKLMRNPALSQPGDGKLLVDFVKELARIKAKTRVRCDTNAYLHRLIAYYERLGFTNMGETKYRTTDSAAVLLEARL